jgi:N-acetylmuramic acid 6-phosphate etherase
MGAGEIKTLRSHSSFKDFKNMSQDSFKSLPITEEENSRTSNLDKLPTLDIIRLINEEDAGVTEAVRLVLSDIARAIEGIIERLRLGGRLFYIGTGTSGRLGVLDASECPPTFGVSKELIQGVIAGGYEACYQAVEASEDNREAGADDLRSRNISSSDAVVGIAASGRTPYTIGGLEYARSLGAFTAAITCVPDSPITHACQVSIVAIVGPEVITGSTRLKAGTAQKMILNMISTATLVRLGYVVGNRMSNLQPRNTKLRDRALRILIKETGLSEVDAETLFSKAGEDLKVALVMNRAECTKEEAKEALDSSAGVVNKALILLQAEDTK